ncbi:hypothetical protein V5O48_012147 [Marasmius crinis-equi]|uniref:AMP-dependent synthetase/ligase domain-containing protein n=1 Tax=Marasmius crinis-equi TaxID=585013 RepID=A0ABR3F429_9AGAR
MTTCNTPLASLALAASQWPSAAIFRTPIIDDQKIPVAPHIIGYGTVTYNELYNYVETTARYWYAKLSEDGIPTGSIVGYCSRGGSYMDFVHIHGLSKAGYVPQAFTRLPQSIEIVKALLEKSGAKALLYEEGYFDSAESLMGPDLKVYPTFKDIPTTQLSEALPDLSEPQPNDIKYVFHTSGSTSGLPKLVPYTSRSVETLLRKAAMTPRPPPGRPSPDAVSWISSACHVSGFSLLLAAMHQGACIIQPTCLPPPIAEFKSMFKLGGLTRVSIFTPLLSRILEVCRTDPELLDLFKNMKSIAHGGAVLPSSDLEWAKLNGLSLVDAYGSTECGIPLMISRANKVGTPEHAYLRPIQLLKEDGTPLIRYRFDPVMEGNDDDDGAALKELVVLRDSADLPHHSLLGGHEDFHTGDLFEEVKPGEYIHRGRVDDWIKMAHGCRCDASLLEDDVKTLCKDLFSDCLVVGSSQPSPVLIVEADTDEEERLRQEIYRRIVNSDRHRKRFSHEQISSPDAIIIVPSGSMMRTTTKGNIRRKAMEEAFGDRIRSIFS